MKIENVKSRKLDNKGFTLIELLAVVVILAVVMGVAMTSVIGSMNNSRKGSLLNSAQAAAQAFQNKYSEAMITGTTGSVLSTTSPSFGGYNFAVAATVTSPYYYYINANSSAELNLSTSNYSLATAATAVQSGTKYSSTVTVSSSFVVFDSSRIVVCLLVPSTSSYYVGQATKTSSTTLTILSGKFTIAASTMYACSDEQKSWT